MKKYSVIIAGMGKLGHVLQEELTPVSGPCLGIRRSPDDSEHIIQADITGDLSHLQLSCDTLIFCASAGSREASAYQHTYVEGLASCQRQIQHQHLIFISSTRVYGYSQGETVDETTPVRAADEQAAALIQAEELLRPDQDTIIRMAGIYGPGRHWMLRKAAAGEWTGDTRYTNRIHIADAACIVRTVVERHTHNEYVPPVIIGCDNHPATMEEVLCWLRTELGSSRQDSARLNLNSMGKRCHSNWLREAGIRLQYPDFRCGYAAETAAFRNRQ